MQPLVSIVAATAQYEAWLATQVNVVKADLKSKHEAMADDPFSFLRATYYRWAQVWPVAGKDWAGLPVQGVGDLHVENFGTWRDAEGRLVWGINDFDECGKVSFTSDLVRLATSALLARREAHLRLSGSAACEAIWRGYNDGLKAGGACCILEEDNGWLRALALKSQDDAAAFWKKFGPKKAVFVKPPAAVMARLKAMLPHGARITRVVHRQSGKGSLGRPRFAVVAEWKGALVAREAKAILANGVDWSKGAAGAQPQNIRHMIQHPLRGTDPFNQVEDAWVLRRLSPNCSRIELADLPKVRDESKLLHAMGFETASIHLGSERLLKPLKAAAGKLKPSWLLKAATAMKDVTLQDWKEWRKQHRD